MQFGQLVSPGSIDCLGLGEVVDSHIYLFRPEYDKSLPSHVFDPKKAIVRWILSNGLPFAIADDFDRLPRDIRTNVDVLARFGPAAVVQRRGPSTCAQ